MKPESAKFIEQASIVLGRAETMLEVGLHEDAARTFAALTAVPNPGPRSAPDVTP